MAGDNAKLFILFYDSFVIELLNQTESRGENVMLWWCVKLDQKRKTRSRRRLISFIQSIFYL